VQFKFIFLPILALVLNACTSPEKADLNRSVAQVQSGSLDRSFELLFDSFLEDTSGRAEIVRPFAATSLQILKRSYYYLDRFDRELDRIHTDCMSIRATDFNAVCESPMDLPDYRKLQASRIVFDRQKDRLSHYYKRLLDLANSQDNSVVLVMESTIPYLAKFSELEQADVAVTARGVLTKWNTDLRDLIEIGSSTEGPITYELAIELFKLKESSHQDWAQLAGVGFAASDLLNDFVSVETDFENRSEALRLEKREGGALEDSPELSEVYESLTDVVTRHPQSVSWRNHTGRSFNRGEWALTYDDGPRAVTTNQILDTLASRGWHATFFWLAKNAKSSSNAKVVRRTDSMKMGLAHHSYTHQDLGKSGANLNREIRDAKSTLESVYGKRLNFFRLPYGSGTKSSRVKNMITSLDMEHFFWNVDSLDWKKSSAAQIYERTKKQMDVQGKGILLFHDIHQRTVDTTKLLARNLPNLNVIKLENGNGVGSRANSGERSSGVSQKPVVTGSFTPHIRQITATALNVRVAGAGTTVCAQLKQNDRVEVVNQNAAGWYQVKVCAGGGWISGGASFSFRL